VVVPPAWAEGAPTADPAPAADAAASTAAELRERGAALCAQGRHDAAVSTLQAAVKQDATPASVGELGACEVTAGRYPSAAEHLQQALRGLPESDTSEQRKRWQALFDQARARIGALTITVDAAGADVLAGSRFLGVSPLAPGEVFVDAGDVLVMAKQPGGGEAEKTVRVAPGGKATVRLAVSAPDASRDPFAPRPRPTLVPAFVLGGAALVAGAVGVALFVQGGEKASEADEKLTALRETYGPVPCPSASGCADLKALRSDRDGLVNAGTGVLIGGGVALAGAVGYAISALRSPSSARWPRTSIVPSVSPAGGGAWLQGAF
jgi:tetratricopeptide (TPR) repeat protein